MRFLHAKTILARLHGQTVLENPYKPAALAAGGT